MLHLNNYTSAVKLSRLLIKQYLSTERKRPTTPLGMLAWEAKNNLDSGGFEAYEMAESVIERIATRKIRESMKEGGFDNLSGSGKSIKNYDFGKDGGISKIISNANVLPKWIEQRKQILVDLQKFHNIPIEERSLIELNELNDRIQSFNLICRAPSSILPILNPDNELLRR
jgi:hypothetical protein